MQDTMRTEIKKRIAPERIPGVYRDTGAGIYLRLMTREDTDRIVAWRNSDAVRKNFIYQALFTRESHENWQTTSHWDPSISGILTDIITRRNTVFSSERPMPEAEVSVRQRQS